MKKIPTTQALEAATLSLQTLRSKIRDLTLLKVQESRNYNPARHNMLINQEKVLEKDIQRLRRSSQLSMVT